MRKSNKKSTAVVVKCSDGAFRKFMTVDDLQIDWRPSDDQAGIPGGVLMQGRYVLGLRQEDRFVAA